MCLSFETEVLVAQDMCYTGKQQQRQAGVIFCNYRSSTAPERETFVDTAIAHMSFPEAMTSSSIGDFRQASHKLSVCK